MRPPPISRDRLLRGLALAGVWLVVATGAFLVLFLSSSRTVVLASHETVVRPTLSRQLELHTGPLLPDLRLASPAPIGADLTLGKTESRTLDELVNRYAFIGSHPEGQIAVVRGALVEMAVAAAILAALVGLAPVLVWLMLGRARRAELRTAARSPRGAVLLLALTLVTGLGLYPWVASRGDGGTARWTSLQEFVGPGLALPADLASIQVRTDVTGAETQRLVASGIETYQESKTWYAKAATIAGGLALRTPEEGETVALLVSDRHDNIGMDPVARAIADSAGATAILDAGDDTSTGRSWEAFSLDSLDAAFSDLERYSVTGNHDHGTFVGDYLADRGWLRPDEQVVDGPGGSVLFGADDPRSSGLGSWRDEPGVTFAETISLVADAVCASEKRVNTLLVHDAALGAEALDRGCVDLVVGGHLHVQLGPTPVTGVNGQVGWSYTTGTTGGAAYAIAVGSKPRRSAEVTLITYRDGRPVGLQPVVLGTDGRFEVHDYVELETGAATLADPVR